MPAAGKRGRRRDGPGRRGGAAAGYDRQDTFYRQAKAEGFRSRAAYKLQELAQRHQLIRRGARVLDLGCWPGGWLQVAGPLAGPMGTVVGIDLRQTDPVPGCVVLCGDITDPARIAELRAAVPGGQYDVVLSDLSPALSGVRARDEARAAELNAITLRIADELLAPGGILLMKIFMDGETEATLRQARRQFASVRLKRPRASRKGSAEQYLIGTAARAGGGAS